MHLGVGNEEELFDRGKKGTKVLDEVRVLGDLLDHLGVVVDGAQEVLVHHAQQVGRVEETE